MKRIAPPTCRHCGDRLPDDPGRPCPGCDARAQAVIGEALADDLREGLAEFAVCALIDAGAFPELLTPSPSRRSRGRKAPAHV